MSNLASFLSVVWPVVMILMVVLAVTARSDRDDD